MFKEVYLFIPGRSGSNAMANYIRSLYPEETKLNYINYGGPFRPCANNLLHSLNEKNGYWFYLQETLFLDRLVSPLPISCEEICRTMNKKIIFGLRDPWNHFASYIRSRENNLARPHSDTYKYQTLEFKLRFMHLYVQAQKDFLREAIGPRKYLPESAVFLNFNEWFKSESYRRELAKKLELEFSDEKLNRMGVYSSFDSIIGDLGNYKNNAQNLKVLERWKEYANNSYYLSLFDEELIELASQVFEKPF